MGEDSTNIPASSSSSLITLRESRRGPLPTFGNAAPARITPAIGRSSPTVGSTSLPSRVLPTFGNPPPSAHVSLPVATPNLAQEVTSRNIKQEALGYAKPSRALPTFGNPPPSAHVSLPVNTTNFAEVTSRNIEKEVNGASPSFILPPRNMPIALASYSSTLPLTSSVSTLSNVSSGPIGFKDQPCDKETKGLTVNEVVSFMDEEKEDTSYFRKEMRARGVTDEMVKKIMMESDNRVGKRKSIKPRMPLRSVDNEQMCANEFLIDEDGVADLCELLMRENRGIDSEFIRSLAEENDVRSLLELMMSESLNPVKIDTWALRMDGFNYYYRNAHIRAVCDKLPQGIVQVKGDSFIMGEVLAEYIRVFKMVYINELWTLIGSDDGVYEKNISQYLGVDSLVSSLSMDSHASPFLAMRRNNEVFIVVRG